MPFKRAKNHYQHKQRNTYSDEEVYSPKRHITKTLVKFLNGILRLMGGVLLLNFLFFIHIFHLKKMRGSALHLPRLCFIYYFFARYFLRSSATATMITRPCAM